MTLPRLKYVILARTPAPTEIDKGKQPHRISQFIHPRNTEDVQFIGSETAFT
jgi:hypothetical protein